MDKQSLEEMIKQLSPELRLLVEAYVELLLQKQNRPKVRGFNFKWAGALKDMKSQYTSVELQHQILKWRAGEK